MVLPIHSNSCTQILDNLSFHTIIANHLANTTHKYTHTLVCVGCTEFNGEKRTWAPQ